MVTCQELVEPLLFSLHGVEREEQSKLLSHPLRIGAKRIGCGSNTFFDEGKGLCLQLPPLRVFGKRCKTNCFFPV